MPCPYLLILFWSVQIALDRFKIGFWTFYRPCLEYICFKLLPFNKKKYTQICLTCFYFQNQCPNLYLKSFQPYFGDMTQLHQDWKTKQNIGNMRGKPGPCHLKDHPEKFKLPQEQFQAFQVSIFHLAMFSLLAVNTHLYF